MLETECSDSETLKYSAKHPWFHSKFSISYLWNMCHQFHIESELGKTQELCACQQFIILWNLSKILLTAICILCSSQEDSFKLTKIELPILYVYSFSDFFSYENKYFPRIISGSTFFKSLYFLIRVGFCTIASSFLQLLISNQDDQVQVLWDFLSWPK